MDQRKEKRVIKELTIEFNKVANMLPPRLREGFKEHCYFGGGCIYSHWHHLKPNDYDIFCDDPLFLIELESYLKVDCDLITENAISFKDKYQLVTKFFGNIMYVIEQFDFKHNMFGFKDGKIYKATEDKYIESNYLRFNDKRTRDVASTITRVPKFVARGMICTRREMARMIQYLLTKTNLEEETISASELTGNSRGGVIKCLLMT